ncbi:hypothetical protein EGW08_022117 [Elysia chlorotica]|uniref:Uncharacterized protein n=1 Tax=Elysia chlorotica TaxID=188477 RepID=A0A3S0Z3W9_ELYCH|nr:hypothetical protein EGW08_022117 [Elysia chlorotica]
MTQVPGVVITVDGDFLGRTQFSTADLSSTPSGPDLKAIAAALHMDLDLYALWLTIINTEDSAAGSESCKDVNRNFKQVCTTDDSQAQAIKVCGQIYTDQKLRECLDYQGLTAEFMNHIFKDCMRAICEKDRVWCKVTKSHIMERHCKVPRSLAQFDCDSLKDVEHLEPNSTSDLAEQTEHSFYRLHHQLPVPE